MVAFVMATPVAASPLLIGYWDGTMTREGADLAVSMEFASGKEGIAGRFTSLTQRVMDYPLDSVKTDGDAVQIVFEENKLEGRIAGDRVTGTFEDGDGAGTFALRRATKPPLPYRITEVTFRNDDVTLAGSLLAPNTSGKHPAVILLQGAGPETRWGTNRFIADHFARAGIVTLIFDKRGSGASTGDWRTADFTDLARDALAGIALLRSRPEVEAKRIGLHGHSQGGMIGPIAATLAPEEIAFLVAEDTFAGPVWQQDIYRVRNSLAREFPADAERAMRLYTLFVEVARGLRPYEELEAASASVRPEPWFEWLGMPPREHWIWPWYAKIGDVDTLTYWRQVKCPTLLVFGERDRVVPVDEGIATIGAALDANGVSYAAWIAPRAEHNLTIRPQQGERFFWWRAAPGIIDSVAAWIAAGHALQKR